MSTAMGHQRVNHWFKPFVGCAIVPAHMLFEVTAEGKVRTWCMTQGPQEPHRPYSSTDVLNPYDGGDRCPRCYRLWLRAHQLRMPWGKR